MRYAEIRSLDVSNGEGIGVSLFVQGCLKHCKNCFNPNTWDLNLGKEFTSEIQNKFLFLLSPNYIKRVSFLGGEPLLIANKDNVQDSNAYDIYNLSNIIKYRFPKKKLWLYTGYTWEEIMQSDLLTTYISNIDYIVDGPYIDELRDYRLLYRGSSNQRIIDVQNSLKENKLIIRGDIDGE